jgi:uncharacterized membrane protein YphA (DoxX/SURF4 family)
VLAAIAAVLLGAVFVVSGVAKLREPARWRQQAGQLIEVPLVAGALPLVEVGIGALLVVGWQRRAVALVAALLLVAFTAVLIVRIAQGRRPPCACFGSLGSAPIGWVHVLRNGGLIALAAIAAV